LLHSESQQKYVILFILVVILVFAPQHPFHWGNQIHFGR